MTGAPSQDNFNNGTISPSRLRMYEETLAFERVVGAVVPSIFVIVIILGLLGNFLVILIVVVNRQMQNTTNVLIINLAISDFLFLIFCVPFTAADYALSIWPFTRAWCKAMHYFQHVFAYSSVWTLVLMAMDRFLAVVFPVQSMAWRTVKHTWIAVLVEWAAILLANLPHLWITDVYAYTFVMEERALCHFVRLATFTASEIEVHGFYYSFNAFGYVIPLSITLCLYAVMLTKLWDRQPVGCGKRITQESMRNKRRVTILVTTVTGVFAICWMPINICFFIASYSYKRMTKSSLTKEFFYFQVAAQVLAYANSCLNPICYAFLSENFRKGFRRLLFMAKNCSFHSDFKASTTAGSAMHSMRFETTQIRLHDSVKSKRSGASRCSLPVAGMVRQSSTNALGTNVGLDLRRFFTKAPKKPGVEFDLGDTSEHNDEDIVIFNDQVML